jgi:hypothetical protein
VIDDPYSTQISWPNYHSGANGDFQQITVKDPPHAILEDPTSPTGSLRFLPAHPHEGGIRAPANEHARVIASGTSKITGREFALAVAFDRNGQRGPAIAQSTFHHFADYNWDASAGCPSFVDEPPGTSMRSEPLALFDAHRYAINTARWLANQTSAGVNSARPE